ncbi:hypothetical protein GLW08_19115 [Pontibacillus yanchengensis]|uniref:Uncharacterized protein n=2 Tax=Pontibacillus yanchengensis TaxID=462910 RepID=A0ACC7VKX4_9BACI|nr:hypothetical protein [Pontibacillus yanchengensis]MYL33674.1 hypothetical protein [Pontibacillus yanchengensis]MYL55428.1 hypothetical protein [Pontibacillus yanchengensis]
MLWIIGFALVTILSVVFALKNKRPLWLVVPFASILAFMFVKIAMVPLPFWETVQFIFNLRG